MNKLNISSWYINGLKRYISYFKGVKSPVNEFIDKLDIDDKPDEQVKWLTLYLVLNQQIEENVLEDFLFQLHQKFGDKLFSLPVISEEDLEGLITKIDALKYWELYPKLTGIIWSVGRFLRKYEFEKLFIHTDVDTIAKIIGEEVFYMGQGSLSNKTLNLLYSIYAPKPMGMGLYPKQDKLKIFPGSGSLWLNLLRNDIVDKSIFDQMTNTNKINFINKFHKYFSYEESLLLIHAMKFYRKKIISNSAPRKNFNSPQELIYICQTIVKCNNCDFNENCNTRN